MRICFFEIRSSSLLRFPKSIFDAMVSEHDDLNFTCLVDGKIFASDSEAFCKISNGKSVGFFTVKTWMPNSVATALKKINPDVLVIFAHRIPDLAVMLVAQEMGIKVVYFQHGLYVPFMKRNLVFFMDQLVKTLAYASAAILISKRHDKSWFRGFSALMSVFLLGSKRLSTCFTSGPIVADLALVYGDYWADFHEVEYGYDPTAITVVGAPDLMGVDFTSPSEPPSRANTMCYVAQTLVEDGRLHRTQMKKFLASLSSALADNGLVLLVKLHPRSDLSLYEGLNCEVVLTKDFPVATAYVGHYSTMLVRGAAYTDKFLLAEFDEHPTPIYLSNLATFLIAASRDRELHSVIGSLASAEINALELANKQLELKYYFEPPAGSLYSSVSRLILDLKQ